MDGVQQAHFVLYGVLLSIRSGTDSLIYLFIVWELFDTFVNRR